MDDDPFADPFPDPAEDVALPHPPPSIDLTDEIYDAPDSSPGPHEATPSKSFSDVIKAIKREHSDDEGIIYVSDLANEGYRPGSKVNAPLGIVTPESTQRINHASTGLENDRDDNHKVSSPLASARPELIQSEDEELPDVSTVVENARKDRKNTKIDVAQPDSDGNTRAQERPIKVPKTRVRHAKDALGMAPRRQAKLHDELKKHVRKLVSEKGQHIHPDEIGPPPPKKRRIHRAQPQAQASGEESSGAAPSRITNRDRHKQISHAIADNSLNNRRTSSQKDDVREAMTVFGYNKITSMNAENGERLYKLKGMKTPLKEFQLTAVSWMVKRETDGVPPLGGVLADEMGFGKTVMALGAVVGNPPSKEVRERKEGATLIVLPNIAIVNQWYKMILQHLGEEYEGSILVYRSSQSIMSRQAIADKFIVLTSYSEVRRGYPSQEKEDAMRAECAYGGGPERGEPQIIDQRSFREMFENQVDHLYRIKWFRVILDEVHAIKNIDSKTCYSAQHLKTGMFWGLSGTPLINAAKELFPYLKIIGYEDAQDEEEFCNEYLHDRHRTEKIDALVSLLTMRRTHKDKFLGETMIDLPASHPGDQWVTLTGEERIIYDLTSSMFDPNDPFQQLVMRLRQRQAVSHPYCLEKFFRTKLEEPTLQQYIRRLTEVEGRRTAYSQIGTWQDRHIHSEYDDTAEASMGSRTLIPFGKSDFGGKFFLVKLLELAVNTVRLREEKCTLCDRDTGNFVKPKPLKPCGHIFCQDCIMDKIEDDIFEGRAKYPKCNKKVEGFRKLDTLERMTPTREEPRSNKTLNMQKTRKTSAKNADGSVKNRRPASDFFGLRPSVGDDEGGFFKRAVADDMFKNGGVPAPSAKITAAKDTILRWMMDDPSHKGIIFTQFLTTSMIVGRMLQQEGIEFIYLNGKMSGEEKIKAIEAFQQKPKIKYMVASMRCGGQALNLTCASRVILLDIWWNEAAEAQAFARVWRQGQRKETHLVRILARDTADEEIKEKQQAKTEAIDKVTQDDGHETNIKSEFEIIKILYPDTWGQMVRKALEDVLREYDNATSNHNAEPEEAEEDERVVQVMDLDTEHDSH